MGRGGLSAAVICTILFVATPLSRAGEGLVLRVVTPTAAKVLWEKPVRSGDRLILSHRNSVFGATVWECLRIEENRTFQLIGVRTERPAVLEYYGLEASQKDWIPLDRRFKTLKILVSPTSAFILAYLGEQLDLSTLAPEEISLEIELQSPSRNMDPNHAPVSTR